MFCPKCGARNDDGARFCAECGQNLSSIGGSADDLSKMAGDLLHKTGDMLNAGAKKASQAVNVGMQRASQAANEGVQEKASDNLRDNGFVDPSETVVATIGSGYLQNYLTNGTLSRGYGILTQKRFYYKGDSFEGKLRSMTSTQREGVVSIGDITFTEFQHIRHFGALVIAVLLAIVACVLYVLASTDGRKTLEDMSLIILCQIIASIVFFVIYFLWRKTIFAINFAGGCFAFNINWYPIADFKDFQRELHLLKDHIKSRKDG